jgi:T3SS secreted effector EspW
MEVDTMTRLTTVLRTLQNIPEIQKIQGLNTPLEFVSPDLKRYAEGVNELADQTRTKNAAVVLSPRPGLKRAPVWMTATRVQDGIESTDHTFFCIGNPGQGKKSGSAFFSQSSDEKRGGLNVTRRFKKDAKKKVADEKKLGKVPTFSEGALAALLKVPRVKYRSKEDFFFAYAQECQNLKRDISLKDVIGEYIKLTFLGAQEDMEVWLREGNGPEATRPNLAERDRRRFEGPWVKEDTDETRTKELRQLSELSKKSTEVQLAEGPIVLTHATMRRQVVDPLALIEAKQSLLLERNSVDELHNRMGTLVPASLYELGNAEQMSKIKITDVDLKKYRTVREIESESAASKKATYQFAPEKEGEANCNTGAAKFLELAGVPRKNILAATPFQFGLHHKGVHQWNPLRLNATSLEAQTPSAEDKKQEMIDTTSIRTGNINMDSVEAVLKRKAAQIKNPTSSEGLATSADNKKEKMVDTTSIRTGNINTDGVEAVLKRKAAQIKTGALRSKL